MKVKRLIEILQRYDPEAFIGIDLPNINFDYLRELTDKPPCLLHFLIAQAGGCSYTDYPHIPPMHEVHISVALTARDLIAEPFGELVEPDFHLEAN
jgi:hypothetical protein